MEFPITNLLSPNECEQWILAYFHPDGVHCPRCHASHTDAHLFRTTQRSQLTVDRCTRCKQTYNLYSNTVFQQRHLTPTQVVLLIRGVLKGEPAKVLAVELDLHYTTVLDLRRDLQDNARQLQPTTPLPDVQTETDAMFQHAGEKR